MKKHCVTCISYTSFPFAPHQQINDDPSNMVHHVLTKMKEQGKCKSKHIQRILPVSMTCRASLTQIEKAIKPLLEPFFHSDEAKDSTFAILFKARNNNQVIKELS